MKFFVTTAAQFADGPCVVVNFDSGLYWFPVLQDARHTVSMHQCSSYRGLANTRIRARYEETTEHCVTRWTASAKRLRISSVRFAFTETRSRAAVSYTHLRAHETPE